MKRTTAILITVLMFCVACMTVFAETSEQKGAAIKTTVPSTCVLTFNDVDGRIEENGIAVREQETYKRKSIHTFQIIPDEEKAIDKVFFGDTDVTARLNDGCFTTPPLTADTIFKVTFKEAKKPDDTSSENVSSATSSENVSSATDQTSPKTGDRGGAETDGTTHAAVSAAAVISLFILIVAVFKKKKRE